LIIECSACQTRYHYDESRFAGAAVKKIRCTKCATIFEVHNPGAGAASTGSEAGETVAHNAPVLGSDDFSLDTTAMGAGPRKRPVMPPPLPGPAAAPRQAPVVRERSTDEFPRATLPGVSTSEQRRLFLPSDQRLSLACIAGPESGRIFEIEKPRVVLGRASCDIILADSQCSRQHAAIEVTGEDATIIDLGSTNGTYVGEKRIGSIELENRMEFDLGGTTLMFLRTRKEP